MGSDDGERTRPAGRSGIKLVGYAGPQDANTVKGVGVLWEDASGSTGVIGWTGSYWAVDVWVGTGPTDLQHLRRKAAMAKLDHLPRLGACSVAAALERWHGHVGLVPRSDAQASYLERLGLRVDATFPKVLAGRAIGILRQAQDVERGQWTWNFMPDVEAARPLLAAVRSLSPGVNVAELWAVLSKLSDAAFRMTSAGDETPMQEGAR